MFTFTLLTAESGYAFKALQLVFDDLKVLADPCWNCVDPADCLFMEKHLANIDMILLSHSTPEFLGGYALLCMKFPQLMALIPVYATVAVSQLGRVATVESYRAGGHLGPLSSAFMEVSDVDEVFDRINVVKYRQTVNVLENKLVLTAFNAGHTLGGCFWLLTKRQEKIVYAPTWNHSKDSFLNSASFLGADGEPLPTLLRPTVLITGTELGSPLAHKKRTEKFFQLVDATLANGGAVFLPTTVSGRFLELLHLVDEHLANLQTAAIPVYFISYSGTKVLSYAAGLVDWMSNQLIKDYAGVGAEDMSLSRLPFGPSKVDLLAQSAELLQLPGPKVVFASGVDFAAGDLSSEVVQFLCQEEKTTIILTEKSPFGQDQTVASALYQDWHTMAAAKNDGVAEDGIPVPLEKVISLDKWTKEEPMLELDLAAYTERVNATRKVKHLAKVRDKKNENMLRLDADSSSSEEELSSDEEEQKEEAKPAETINEVFVPHYVTDQLTAHKPVDIVVTANLRPRQAMFPYPQTNKKRKVDDYGEVIDHAKYRTSTDTTGNDKLIMESKRKFELSDKRWDEEEEGRGHKNRGENRMTPQEILNTQLLQRNLDALFRPVRRVPMSAAGRKELRVRCGLSYVDLSGLVDVRSMNLIVLTLRPYNLVLLPDTSHTGTAESGLAVVEAAFKKQQKDTKPVNTALQLARFDLLVLNRRGASRSIGGGMNIYTVAGGASAQIGTGSASSEFEVKLDDDLAAALVWQKIEGYRVAQIRGALEVHDGKESKLAAQYLLKPIAGSHEEKGSKLAIGNVRLPELRERLRKRNYTADFKREGTLVVNDTISIRKIDSGYGEDSGDIVIDGTICPLYYEVRNCIREMLAFV